MAWQDSPCIPGGFYTVRRLWIRANGPIDDGLWVCHHCDNPRCVNLEHCWLGIPSEDMQDCYLKGRANYVRHLYSKGNSKLTIEQVKFIRSLSPEEIVIRFRKNEFPVGWKAIQRVYNYERWKGVK